jgi:hypothetical protein
MRFGCLWLAANRHTEDAIAVLNVLGVDGLDPGNQVEFHIEADHLMSRQIRAHGDIGRVAEMGA